MKVYARLVLLYLVSFASAPAVAQNVPGDAVLAKPGGNALVIWDASPVVASIVKTKTPDAEAAETLERDAVRVLAGMSGLVEKSAKSVTVRVTYAETGAVSPVYGTRPFAGIELYATLTAPAADTAGDRDHWKTLGPKTPLPPWFVFKVVGKLPPRA